MDCDGYKYEDDSVSLKSLTNQSTKHHTKTFPSMSKVILITGANRGIGFCIAQGIAQRLEGCCILVASRDLSAAEDAISKLRHLKATFEPVELDVTSDDSIKACLESIRTKYGRLDGTSHVH
jgi:NAD(P)-dependent dehydrogenase (short-subunit alcohol dehydrogenase family)